jgi:hypothetical protein
MKISFPQKTIEISIVGAEKLELFYIFVERKNLHLEMYSFYIFARVRPT